MAERNRHWLQLSQSAIQATKRSGDEARQEELSQRNAGEEILKEDLASILNLWKNFRIDHLLRDIRRLLDGDRVASEIVPSDDFNNHSFPFPNNWDFNTSILEPRIRKGIIKNYEIDLGMDGESTQEKTLFSILLDQKGFRAKYFGDHKHRNLEKYLGKIGDEDELKTRLDKFLSVAISKDQKD